MSVCKALSVLCLLVVVGGVSSCAYLEQAKQSDAFKKFCDWSPVAINGIDNAVVEAEKDPAKLQIAKAMREASGYLKLVSAQCAAPVITVK